MIFAVLVSAMPEQHAGCLTALSFCQAAVMQGHSVSSIFFYGSAVLIAQPSSKNIGSDSCVRFEWQQWAQEQKLRLGLCSAAVTRFGILTPDSIFEISGLGHWVAGIQTANRVVQFR